MGSPVAASDCWRSICQAVLFQKGSDLGHRYIYWEQELYMGNLIALLDWTLQTQIQGLIVRDIVYHIFSSIWPFWYKRQDITTQNLFHWHHSFKFDEDSLLMNTQWRKLCSPKWQVFLMFNSKQTQNHNRRRPLLHWAPRPPDCPLHLPRHWQGFQPPHL